MTQHIGYVTVLVRDYDEAIAYYGDVFGFELREDRPLSPGIRWVLMAPPGATECCLLLAEAHKPGELAALGRQAADRVFLFLHTDDFWRDYQRLKARGVEFIEQPRTESYGIVVVLRDLHGNKWDLLQLISATEGGNPAVNRL